jgi:hypothetical protein
MSLRLQGDGPTEPSEARHPTHQGKLMPTDPGTARSLSLADLHWSVDGDLLEPALCFS